METTPTNLAVPFPSNSPVSLIRVQASKMPRTTYLPILPTSRQHLAPSRRLDGGMPLPRNVIRIGPNLSVRP
uniref:Uncharacterized protein n=1 Tax=Pristionchus pacificus TaxID=54126 RepID=A0A2A6CM51_PRIPA